MDTDCCRQYTVLSTQYQIPSTDALCTEHRSLKTEHCVLSTAYRVPLSNQPRTMTTSILHLHSCRLCAAVLIAASAFASPADAARLALKSICRIKDRKRNTIQGLGVIVGLKGTGDNASYLPTIRSVGKIMAIMGNPQGDAGLAELKDTKNVALVTVTAVIPAAGAAGRQDRLRRQLDRLGQEPRRRAAVPHAADRSRPPNVRGFTPSRKGRSPWKTRKCPTRAEFTRAAEEEFFNAFTKDNRFTLVGAELDALRATLGERLGLPVLLGYGPRYMHSIGQLYKGGPTSGMFLMITAEKSSDLAIPGAKYTFGQLEMAQALGDLESLGRLGKPALRLHLTEGAPAGLASLRRAVDQALAASRSAL